jgi:hypothetical protein
VVYTPGGSFAEISFNVNKWPTFVTRSIFEDLPGSTTRQTLAVCILYLPCQSSFFYGPTVTKSDSLAASSTEDIGGFGIVGLLVGGAQSSWRFPGLASLIGGNLTFLGTMVGHFFVSNAIYRNSSSLLPGVSFLAVTSLFFHRLNSIHYCRLNTLAPIPVI